VRTLLRSEVRGGCLVEDLFTQAPEYQLLAYTL
jgi:hypothetical protein